MLALQPVQGPCSFCVVALREATGKPEQVPLGSTCGVLGGSVWIWRQWGDNLLHKGPWLRSALGEADTWHLLAGGKISHFYPVK